MTPNAVLCGSEDSVLQPRRPAQSPYRLPSGRTLKLRYRILVHSQPMTQAEFEGIGKDFSRDASNNNPHRITMP